MAPLRMQLYLDYSAAIYGIYLKYISKDHIYVYSIAKVFYGYDGLSETVSDDCERTEYPNHAGYS